MDLTTEEIALIATIAVALTSILTVVGNFGAKWLEQRYLVSKEKQTDTEEATSRQDILTSRTADREQDALQRATELMERYATRLEGAYDRERARRELLDEEVARLTLEVSGLRYQVRQLNEQLSRLTGLPALPMPRMPEREAREPIPANAVEKREAVVGVKPESPSNGVK